MNLYHIHVLVLNWNNTLHYEGHHYIEAKEFTQAIEICKDHCKNKLGVLVKEPLSCCLVQNGSVLRSPSEVRNAPAKRLRSYTEIKDPLNTARTTHKTKVPKNKSLVVVSLGIQEDGEHFDVAVAFDQMARLNGYSRTDDKK